MKELLNMLTFFHDNGDVIYDSVDCVLRQFVILNPQVMIDIMQALVVVPEYPDMKFRSAWQHFERTGFLEPSLLEHIILSRLPASNEIQDEHLEVTIGMLQAKDLICKIEGCKHGKQKQTQDMYMVPSKLPKGPNLSQLSITWNKCYFISFGTLLPDAVFFRLICRCVSYSDIVSCGPDQCMIFKEGGLFTLGQNFLFMLRKRYQCKEQCVIEVSVKAVHAGCCLEVLKYLCRILETLRCRDFRNLRFEAGPICCYDAPHQDCEGSEMLHILDLVSEMESQEPITSVLRQCNGRPVHIDLETVDTPFSSDESSDEDLHGDVHEHRNVMVSGNRSHIARHKVKATDSDFLAAIQILGHDELKKLFYALGMKQRDIEMVDKCNATRSEDLLAIDILQKWQKADGPKATRQAVLDALRYCNNIEAEEELTCKWNNKLQDTLSGSDFFDVVEMLRTYDLIKLLNALHVDQHEIRKFSKDILGNGVELRAMEVFQRWRKTKGPKATRQAIINGLRRCNNAEAEEELLDLWNKKGSHKPQSETSSELASVDVYISFSLQDEGWVLETLVRFLRETPHYLTICRNQYDVTTYTTDPRRHIRGRQQNSKQIASCKVFIAVNSRHYIADQTGRLKFEREVARRCNVPIIVVNLNSTQHVADLFDTESISFSKKETSSQGECLDLLLSKINPILGNY
ncbi:uncharacterized protein [Amphiura filiformis]|uniref:uncharacterized protein isoform X2 n=1 Tax=Amphiura filiformis TaxID=82378 RepID=UPI003B228EE9